MNIRLFLGMFLVLVSTLGLVACAGAQKEMSIEVSCDDFTSEKHISREVEIAVDGSLTIALCSNPTTGFQWETAEISNQTILEQVDYKFIGPESDPPPPPGTPGQGVWTFDALKKGTTTVSIDYSRPWEGGEKGEWTFVSTVVVK